jgi:hypothetical protein
MPIGSNANLQIYVEILSVGFNYADLLLLGKMHYAKTLRSEIITTDQESSRLCAKIIPHPNKNLSQFLSPHELAYRLFRLSL